MRWRWLAAIPVGAALVLSAMVVTAAVAATSPNPGNEVPATAPAPSQPAGAPLSVDTLEAQMLSMINAERAAAGVGPVQPVGWAHSVAQQHSQDMAAAGDIWHNIAGFINKGRASMGATYLGENVAMDSTLAADDALLFSDIPHRNVTLDARFNFVGVGIALDSKNWVYVTEDFAQIPGGAPAAVAAKPAAPVVQTKPVTPVAATVAKARVAKAPVAAAPVKPKAVVPAGVAPAAVQPAAVAAAPAQPTTAPVPARAPAPAQPIAAKPIAHTTHVNGGIWILVGMSGLALAAFSVRNFLMVFRPRALRQQHAAPLFSLGSGQGTGQRRSGSGPRWTSPWQRAA